MFYLLFIDTGKDLYGSLFGEGYGGANQKLPDPPKDIIVYSECTLEEFYNGCMKCVNFERNILTAQSNTTKKVHETKYFLFFLLYYILFIREFEVKPGYGKTTILKFPGEGNEEYTHTTGKNY
jgi:hypothetical protein